MTALLVALAPALVFMAAVCGLVVMLALWFDRLPLRIFGLFLFVVFAFFARPLLFGDVLLPLNLLRYQPVFKDLPVGPGPGGYVDQADLIEDFPAYTSQVRVALRRGEWPLLARSIGAGEPLLANSQAQVLHPFSVLAYLLPQPSIYGLLAALKVFTCLVFTFLLLRRFGLARSAAAGGAIAYGASGFLMHYLGWPHTNSAAALPLLLYALDRVIAGSRSESPATPFRADALLLTFSVYFLATGGHPETMVYVAGAGAAFAVERLLRRSTPRGSPHPIADPVVRASEFEAAGAEAGPVGASAEGRAAAAGTSRRDRGAWVAAMRLAACGLVGGALAAPVLLPAFEAVAVSERKYLVERAKRQIHRNGPLESVQRGLEDQRENGALVKRTLPLLAPLAYGSERFGNSWGYASIIQEGSGFAGTACLLVLAWALVQPGTWRRRTTTIPEPSRKRRRYPSTGKGEPPWTIYGLGLAGFLFHVQPPGLIWLTTQIPVISNSASSNRRMNLLLCFALATLAAFAWDRLLARGAAHPRRGLIATALGLSVALWWIYRSTANPANPVDQALPRLMTLQQQLAVIFLLTIALSFLSIRRPSESRVANPCTGRSVPDLGASARVMSWSFPVLLGVELFLLHAPLQQASPRASFFPQRPSITFLQEHIGEDRMMGLGGYFTQNLPTPYGLDDVRSGSPLQPSRLMLLTRHLRASTQTRALQVADDQVLNLLGVRFVVSGPGYDLPAHVPLRFSGNVEVYERPDPLPRLFFIKNATSSRELTPLDLPKLTQNFRVHGFVDEVPAELRDGEQEVWRAVDPDASALEIVEIAPAHLRARASVTHPALLGSGQYQDGAWRVLVDGRRAREAVTNGLFVGAWIEPGEHRLDLVYRPLSFLFGCLIAAGAAIVGLVVLLPVQQERRRVGS